MCKHLTDVVARCTTGPRRAYSRVVDRRDAPLGLAELGRVEYIVNQDRCYSSKFLRSSARRLIFEILVEILVRGTRYEVARAGLVH